MQKKWRYWYGLSQTEHTSTDGRGGEYTCIISTGVIPIHHIRVDDGDGAGSRNTDSENGDDAENSVLLSSSSSYWGRTTKLTKDEIPQQRVVCVKSKRGYKVSSNHNLNHANAEKALSQNFGAAKKFVPNNPEGDSE